MNNERLKNISHKVVNFVGGIVTVPKEASWHLVGSQAFIDGTIIGTGLISNLQQGREVNLPLTGEFLLGTRLISHILIYGPTLLRKLRRNNGNQEG